MMHSRIFFGGGIPAPSRIRDCEVILPERLDLNGSTIGSDRVDMVIRSAQLSFVRSLFRLEFPELPRDTDQGSDQCVQQ